MFSNEFNAGVFFAIGHMAFQGGEPRSALPDYGSPAMQEAWLAGWDNASVSGEMTATEMAPAEASNGLPMKRRAL